MEQEGKIYVIRPDKHVTVQRTEKDKRKLEALYEDGRRLAEENMGKLKKYLEIEEVRKCHGGMPLCLEIR